MGTAILTIDDLASKNTPAIIDYLKEKGIQAVLFATGENVQHFYEEALYAVRSGMVVGNHSYSHPHFSEISFDEAVDEIVKCEEVLDQLYKDAGVDRIYRPFRFPYGDKGGANKEALQRYFKENGFHKLEDAHIPYPWWHEQGLDEDIDTYWTFDFEEYLIRPDSDFNLYSVFEKMYDPAPAQGAAFWGEDNHHIFLLHAHDETEAMAPEYYKLFIDQALEGGIQFIVGTFKEA